MGGGRDADQRLQGEGGLLVGWKEVGGMGR